MAEIFKESFYYGAMYVQMVVFIAAMMMNTPAVPSKKKGKTVVYQWGLVAVGAFMVGFLFNMAASSFVEYANLKAQTSGIIVIQLLYSAITVFTVLINTLPSVIVVAGTLWIHKGKKNTRIFLPVLFMLVVALLCRFAAEVVYNFFSPGDDGYERFMPSYSIRSVVDLFTLVLACLLYWKFFKKKLTDLLSFAEEQIGHIILVPCFSYVIYQIAKGTLSTYSISFMAIDPGTFLIAVIIRMSLLIMYCLMYWAIFKAVVVAAGSAQVKAELDVASKIQLSALPSKFPAFPKRRDVDVFAAMHPAKEVGGDFYDFFFIDEERLAVLIADVSGKGVPAALFMMSGRAIIRNQALLGMDPGEIFCNANNQLAENNKEGMFITAFLGIINVKSGEFCYCNAGHNMPYIVQPNGDVRELQMKPGFVLAGLKNIKYKTETSRLELKEKLVLYTDGVTEAINKQVEMYTEERLKKVLGDDASSTVRETVEHIVDSVNTFADGAEQFDDITVLTVVRM